MVRKKEIPNASTHSPHIRMYSVGTRRGRIDSWFTFHEAFRSGMCRIERKFASDVTDYLHRLDWIEKWSVGFDPIFKNSKDNMSRLWISIREAFKDLGFQINAYQDVQWLPVNILFTLKGRSPDRESFPPSRLKPSPAPSFMISICTTDEPFEHSAIQKGTMLATMLSSR